ncbi:MAG TPA: anthrax toxin-like adenylyl cyclase domain-containing protein, partial [Gemmatimonadaceae bacterium]|nr:anthrax toxin-like adenylyl cyclase domain-containing protein [Gemmatimonadaceae bacterium]
MAVVLGIAASFGHDQNGMTRSDMEATARVADRLAEVIIFRSTGPWAKRWIEWGYPTKNFHVKGKSSDWGPHAGLVPYDGTYSKVGFNAAKAAEGTKQNDKGLQSGFAGKSRLILTTPQIDTQLTRPEGRPPRTAIQRKFPIEKSNDFILIANRSGDGKEVAFRAVSLGGDRYEIQVYPESAGTNVFRLIDRRAGPFEVMTSNEEGTDKPMTGDYDLLAICPSWAQYGSQSATDIVKPGIRIKGMAPQPGATFSAGVGMDNVLDPSLHTHGTSTSNHDAMSAGGYQRRRERVLGPNTSGPVGPNSLPTKAPHRTEHPDMGNLTPRILRCINTLNIEMGATGTHGALRRVHHNAESHRNAMF